MEINFSTLGSLLPKPDANIKAEFLLDSEVYRIEQFDIDFLQEVDFKGQPQHETKGGRFSITISQLPDSSIYEWARKSKMGKDGIIKFFSETMGTFFRIDFTNGHCVGLSTGVDSQKGTITNLFISCETVKINDITHSNKWVN